jgi:hypothetical protein
MFQQWRSIQLPLVRILLFCMLVSIYAFACKRRAQVNPTPTIVQHPVETDPNEALECWRTPGKMSAAKPATLPHVKTPSTGKKRPQRPSA